MSYSEHHFLYAKLNRVFCRVTVVLLPDPALGAKVESEEKAKLEAKMKSMQAKDGEGCSAVWPSRKNVTIKWRQDVSGAALCG